MLSRNRKTGIPFIIFLVVITAFLSYWFLREKGGISEEAKTITDLDINQTPVVDVNNNSEIVEDAESKVSTFQNPTQQFKVILQENEEVKETSSEGIYTLYFNEDTISVMEEDMEGIIRGSVGINSEEEVIMDGVKGSRIIASSAKDGSEVTLILVKNGSKLYHFQGSDSFLDRMIKDFSFTN